MKIPASAKPFLRLLFPWGREGLRFLSLASIAMRQIKALANLPLQPRMRDSFRTRIRQVPPGRSVVVLTHETSREVLAALHDMEAAGRTPSRILTLSETLHAFLRDREYPSSLSRDMNMDLHEEVTIHERSHDFLTGARTVLDMLSFEGMGAGDLLRTRLYFLDILLRRAERDIRACWSRGEETVVVIGAERKDYCLGLRTMAARMTEDRKRVVGTSFIVVPRILGYLPSRKVRETIDKSTDTILSIYHYLLSVRILARLIRWIQSLSTSHARLCMPIDILVATDVGPETIYWRALGPVIKAMAGRDKRVGLCLSSPTAIKWAVEHGLAYQTTFSQRPSSRVPPDLAVRLKETSGRPAVFAERCRACSPAEHGFAVAVAGCETTGYIFTNIAVDAATFLQLITDWTPHSVLVMPHWGRTGAAAIAAARRAGVPTVSFPSVTVSGDRWSIVDWSMDVIGCYGMQCADAFAAVGHPREQLVSVGSVPMDRLYRLDEDSSRARLTRQHAFGFGRKIVLVATTHIHDDECPFINALVDACSARGDAVVVVKPHYNYSQEDYRAVRPSPHVRILFDTDIYDLAQVCTVCVTDMSTVGAEAAMLNKPLLVVNLTEKPFVANRYDEYGIALAVNRLQDVSSALDRVLDDSAALSAMAEARGAFFEQFNHGADGKAAERMADLVLDPFAVVRALASAHPGAISPALTRRLNSGDSPTDIS